VESEQARQVERKKKKENNFPIGNENVKDEADVMAGV
jgi:hypothetical protein